MAPRTVPDRGPVPSGLTLLVVDDDCDMRDSLAALLTDAGYGVVCKKDGSEALQYLRRRPAPAAILLDLFMPSMNGWEFVKRLKSTGRLAGIPVVMVTATAPHWGYPVPDSLVLRKPVDPERLLSLVRQVTEPGLAA